MGFMRPKIKQVAPPPPPTIEDTDAKMEEQAAMLRRRRGRASAVLSQRDSPQPMTASKALLGG